jgi:hypothetical protein
MEFFIKKNATLPVLKLQVVKDGRSDYDSFMKTIELSAIFFSMVDSETGIPKISSRPAGFVEKTFLDPNAESEYYIYYQFTSKDTNRVGTYEGQFMLRNDDGVLILPIREKLTINVQDSFIADDLIYDSCYVSEFPCCVNGPFVSTTTTTPCPPCPTCPEPTPTPQPTTTTTTYNPNTTTTSTYHPNTTTTSTYIPGTTTTSTTIPQPTGYTEWVISTGIADYEGACAKTDEWKTVYTPELNELPIGQTLYSTSELITPAFTINQAFFKILTRNGITYDPSTIICVGPYNFYSNNYCQVIDSYECGTPIPCNSMTFTKTQDVPYSFIIYGCDGRFSPITLSYGQSTTLCVSTYVPQQYITAVTNGVC